MSERGERRLRGVTRETIVAPRSFSLDQL